LTIYTGRAKVLPSSIGTAGSQKVFYFYYYYD